MIQGLTGRLRRLMLPALLLLPLLGCGKECDVCETDDDCAAEGLVCVNFDDGSKRCGSGQGATVSHSGAP